MKASGTTAMRMQRTRWEHLQPVHVRVENGDFEGALREYHTLLSRPAGNRQADLVLFDMGLLYSHYANPKKDYEKALSCFTRLVSEYPQSPLAEEAKIWIDLLGNIEKTKRVDLELDEKHKAMNR